MKERELGALTLVVTAFRCNFLTEAMISVAAQTRPDFELLCCADTHRDDSVAARFDELLEFVPAQRKRVIRIAGNGTAGFVRNRAFDQVRTPWIGYLDGDDYLHPRAMEAALDAIARHGEDTRLFSSGMARVDPQGIATVMEESLSYYPPDWIYVRDPDQHGHCTYFNQLQLIRREAWADYRYDESTNGEDIDFALHQLLLGRDRKISACLYYLRDTPDSFSKREFAGGDICTERYRSGYYERLWERLYSDQLAANFLTTRSA